MLEYDESAGGYVVDLDKQQLERAPYFDDRTGPDWSNPGYTRGIDDYYGVTRRVL